MGEDILIQGNIIAGKKSPISNVSNDIVNDNSSQVIKTDSKDCGVGCICVWDNKR